MTDPNAGGSIGTPPSVTVNTVEARSVMAIPRVQMSDAQRAKAEQEHAEAVAKLPPEPTDSLVANQPTIITVTPRSLQQPAEPTTETEAAPETTTG